MRPAAVCVIRNGIPSRGAVLDVGTAVYRDSDYVSVSEAHLPGLGLFSRIFCDPSSTA